MRFKTYTTRQQDRVRQGAHRWFAWFPVAIEGQIIWLEFVYRKRVDSTLNWEFRFYWSYSLIPD